MADLILKSGAATSEFSVAQSVKTWAIVLSVLGMVESFGSMVAQSMGADTKIGVLVGAVVAIAGIIGKTLVSLGYSKSRADVKVAIATPVDPAKIAVSDGPEIL
jgi:hypothetical protein